MIHLSNPPRGRFCLDRDREIHPVPVQPAQIVVCDNGTIKRKEKLGALGVRFFIASLSFVLVFSNVPSSLYPVCLQKHSLRAFFVDGRVRHFKPALSFSVAKMYRELRNDFPMRFFWVVFALERICLVACKPEQ